MPWPSIARKTVSFRFTFTDGQILELDFQLIEKPSTGFLLDLFFTLIRHVKTRITPHDERFRIVHGDFAFKWRVVANLPDQLAVNLSFVLSALSKRPKGVEPSITAWEAIVLPLH